MSNKVTCLILLLWLLLGGCSCGPLANRGPHEQDAAITSLLNSIRLRPVFSKGTSYVGIKTTGATLPKRLGNYCSPLTPLRLVLGIEKKTLPNGSRVALSPNGAKPALTMHYKDYKLEIEPLGSLRAFGYDETSSYELLFFETGIHGDEMPLVLVRVFRNGNILEEGKIIECAECWKNISPCSEALAKPVLDEWNKVSALLDSADVQDTLGPLVPGADACMTARGETRIGIGPLLQRGRYHYDEASSRRHGFLVLSNPSGTRIFILVGEMRVPPISINFDADRVLVNYKIDTNLEKLIVNDHPEYLCCAEKLNPTLILFDGERYFTRYTEPIAVNLLSHKPLGE